MSRVVFAETLRRHLTAPAYLVFVGGITAIAAIIGRVNGSSGLWQGLWSLLTVILGAQLIGPEFSSGTLQLILAKPVNRSSYLLGRFAGVVAAAWIAIIVPLLFDLGGRLLFYNAPSDWRAAINSTGGEALHALLVCALLSLFGSISRSYFNVAIYFVLSVGLTLLIAGLRLVAGGLRAFDWLSKLLVKHPGILRGVEAIHENLFPTVPPRPEPVWVMLIVSNAAIALLLACMFFRRREVPYGAD